MESVLAQPRYRVELKVREQSAHGTAAALALLRRLAERLTGPPRDIPPEFFLYPFP
jgi:hypothetical protein